MMRVVSVDELNIIPELVFNNVQCRLKDAKEILGDCGSLVSKGMNVFQYRTFVGAPNINTSDPKLSAEYYDMEITDSQLRGNVIKLLKRGYRCLVKVTSKACKTDDDEFKRIFIVHLAFFIEGNTLGTLPIVVRSKVINTLKRKGLLRDENSLEQLLQQNFMLSDGIASNGCIAFFKTNPKDISKNDDLESSKDISVTDDFLNGDGISVQSTAQSYDFAVGTNKDYTEILVDYNINVSDDDNLNDVNDFECESFTLFGKEFNIVIQVIEADGGYHLVASRYLPRNKRPVSMYIGNASIRVTTEYMTISQKIGKIFSQSGEYVKIWSAYSNIEGDVMLQRARAIGVLAFDTNQKVAWDENGGIIIMLNESVRPALSLLNSNDYIECVDEIPEYLNDDSITWEEYKTRNKGVTNDLNAQNGMTEHLPQTQKDIKNGKLIKIKSIDNYKCGIILETDTIPKGKLILSLRGFEKQITRRENARDNIMSGNVPNPRIASIIANDIVDDYATNRIDIFGDSTKIPALSGYVKDKIFPINAPTPVQERAIEIALNTPDIAIIQGPPGTGKTTVITAILERLNELSNKTINNSGSVLITSLQHDAVTNVIERMRINSLPTLKFGRKLDQEDSVENTVNLWVDELIKKINTKNPNLANQKEKHELIEQYSIYATEPSNYQAVIFLNYMLKRTRDKDIADKINDILLELRNHKDFQLDEIIRDVRRLRTTGKSFMDDGAQMAGDLYVKLEGLLDQTTTNNKEILDTLREAFSLSLLTDNEVKARLKADNQKLLKRLEAVKVILLERCVPKPNIGQIEPREDIQEIFELVRDSFQATKNTVDGILVNLLDELENNPLEIRNSISSYSCAYAATAQASEGYDIRNAKGLTDKTREEKEKHPEYETVIVDEAARVNPGDLMVPLSQAKERIILVGDHRQLPHMYDQEIFDVLQERGLKYREDDIQISMFEQLITKVKALEKIDGKQRFITLDKQYRTHPLLGNFVSNEYYEPNGEQYSSPLGEEYFRQEHFEKPLVWIDVPFEKGSESKSGTSRLRKCEAQIIAERICQCIAKDDAKIKELLAIERKRLDLLRISHDERLAQERRFERELERKRLSYGVITFYSSQVNVIRQELKSKLHDRVDELFRRQKLRVGSVDAFQGMEFDIIFLSIVRTNKKPIDAHILEKYPITELTIVDENIKDKYEIIAARNYGFLSSKNRMCVAMSRQKKVLVVVGDSNIFVGEQYSQLAERFVPGMKHLYELSCKEGVVERVN